MNYLSQFLIILGFTFTGEALQRIIPLPIPASVYGLALLFLALCLKLVKVDQVKQTGAFLTSILPILFVSPAVNIVDDWGLIRNDLLPIVLIMMGSTLLGGGEKGREMIYGHAQLMQDIRKASAGVGNVTFNMTINAAEGQDTDELAEIVTDKMIAKMRRLAVM